MSLKTLLRPVYVPIANFYHARFKAPKRYRYLFETITQLHATRIMEVGTWNGERAIQMIEAAKRASPNATIEYYGFDLFEGMTKELFVGEISKWPPSEAQVQAKLATTGASIHLYKGDTKETLPRVYSELPKMDFIFIDGGHHIDTIRNDWNYASKVMHEKAAVIFDDYWRNRSDHGCKLIVDGLDRNIYNAEVLPVIDSFTSDEFGRLDISFARVTLR